MMKRILIRVDLDSLLLNPNGAIREGNSKRAQILTCSYSLPGNFDNSTMFTTDTVESLMKNLVIKSLIQSY